ncbi:sensor histidine kinase [Flavobacteriaceae bacterium R38]|nr:sensor histidine kinase [Flavobacteriaceae bacterium R38]
MMSFIKSYWSVILMVLLLVVAAFFGIDADVRVNLFLLILISFGFVFLIQWLIQKRNTNQLKAMHIQFELDLLKSQIDPHFYFNTLNNLYGLAKRKSDNTSEVVLKLSEVMRYVIYKGKKDRVSIEEEIEYLENYIELQKLRLNKETTIHFKKSLLVNSIEIAPLLLIIPLENAFKHGVDSLLNDAYIDMILIVDESKILFEVTNNFKEKDANTSQGIGLENLKKRLQILYKDKHTINITKKNDIYKFELLIRR